MNIFHLILLVLSLVCFLIAAWRPTSPDYGRLMAGGLAALVASMLASR